MTDKEWQIEVLGENPKCELCQRPAVVAHHFISKGASEKLRHVVSNGIKLCYVCHRLVHEHAGYKEKIINLKGKEWHKNLLKIQYQ